MPRMSPSAGGGYPARLGAIMPLGFTLPAGERVTDDVTRPANLPKTAPPLLDNGLTWPVRSQGATMLCTAYTVAACLELDRINRCPGLRKGEVPRYSAGFLYWGMSTCGDSTQEGWSTGGRTFDDAVKALAEAGMCDFADFGALAAEDPDFANKLTPAQKATCPDGWGGGPPRLEAQQAGRVWAKAWRDRFGSSRPDEEPCCETVPPDKWATLDASVPVFRWAHEFIIAELIAGRPVGLAFPNFIGPDVPHLWISAGSDPNGTLVFPKVSTAKSYSGGHAVCITGLELDDQVPGGGWFRFRNSLGAGWGDKGYGRVAIFDACHYCWSIFALPGERGPWGHELHRKSSEEAVIYQRGQKNVP